jgi:hypothetical protein
MIIFVGGPRDQRRSILNFAIGAIRAENILNKGDKKWNVVEFDTNSWLESNGINLYERDQSDEDCRRAIVLVDMLKRNIDHNVFLKHVPSEVTIVEGSIIDVLNAKQYFGQPIQSSDFPDWFHMYSQQLYGHQKVVHFMPAKNLNETMNSKRHLDNRFGFQGSVKVEFLAKHLTNKECAAKIIEFAKDYAQMDTAFGHF